MIWPTLICWLWIFLNSARPTCSLLKIISLHNYSYVFSLSSLSLRNLWISSTASLTMVTIMTNTRGATYVKRNPVNNQTRKIQNNLPTLNGGKNWEIAITRKNKLKKNLNWLMRTTGIKVMIEYFWLQSLLLQNLLGSVFPLMFSFLSFGL